ncbi:hypothetical protein CYMTET_21280 [Cymbomonas tetramitiformis]|uniref:J domain-containing protein n=1 Tax=Cymbomonas tetramitiformis TaxID=36881 RepID=A0AAE0L312_9CHLO|nr:hypothetical protein CYMTET_21280 [Cymbomonas tetramitiformis]
MPIPSPAYAFCSADLQTRWRVYAYIQEPHICVLPLRLLALAVSDDCTSLPWVGGVDLGQIKDAFRDRAKELHPDSSTATNDFNKADHEAFARLVDAREVLGCPKKRALYDLNLESGGFTAGAEKTTTESNTNSRQASNNKTKYRRRRTVTDEELRSWLAEHEQSLTNTDYERQLRRELQDALINAYLGPELEEATRRQFPYFFEGEERSSSGEPDVLQLVSGRTLLGVVRSREAPNALSGRASPSEAAHATDRCEGYGSGGPAVSSKELDLLYGECGVVRSSTLTTVACPDDGVPKECVTLHQDGEVRHRIFGLQQAMDPQNFGAAMSVHNAAGHKLLSGLHFTSPGVTHVQWHTSNGQCLWRCRRAHLPPAYLWLFPPRSANHSIGGWYFERYGRGSDELEAQLDATIPVLMAAHITIAQEHRRSRTQRQGPSHGAIRSMVEWLPKAMSHIRWWPTKT